MITRLALLLALVAGAGAPRAEESWEALDAEIVALAQAGDLDAAQKKAEQALALARREFGKDDARTGASVTLLGEIHMSADRWAEAEPLLREGMEIRARVLEPLESDHEQSYNLLARTLAKLGRNDDAERLYLRSVAEATKAADAGLQGRNAPRWTDLVFALKLLADFYDERDDAGKAAESRRRALQSVQKYGAGQTEWELHLLGTLFDEAIAGRDYAGAETIARARVAASAKLEGEESIARAEALNALAKALSRLEREDETAELHEQALVIAEKALAKDDARLATYLGPVATLRRRADLADEAERLYRRALDLMATDEEPDPFQLADNAGSLAELYEETDRHTLAEPLRRRVLEIYEPIYGTPDWMVAHSSLELAENLRAQKKWPEAIAAFEQVATATEEGDLTGDDDYARALRRLVEIALRLGKLGDAADAWARIVDLNVIVYGAEAPQVAAARRSLAALKRVAGRGAATKPAATPAPAAMAAAPPARLTRELALELSDLVLAVDEQIREAGEDAGVESTRQAGSIELWAELMADEGNVARAAEEYEKALSIRLKAQGRGHADTRRTAERLAGMYDGLGLGDNARTARQRAGID